MNPIKILLLLLLLSLVGCQAKSPDQPQKEEATDKEKVASSPETKEEKKAAPPKRAPRKRVDAQLEAFADWTGAEQAFMLGTKLGLAVASRLAKLEDDAKQSMREVRELARLLGLTPVAPLPELADAHAGHGHEGHGHEGHEHEAHEEKGKADELAFLDYLVQSQGASITIELLEKKGVRYASLYLVGRSIYPSMIFYAEGEGQDPSTLQGGFIATMEEQLPKTGIPKKEWEQRISSIKTTNDLESLMHQSEALKDVLFKETSKLDDTPSPAPDAAEQLRGLP